MLTEKMNQSYHPYIAKAIENIEQVVVGKVREIELSIVALLSGGHILLEDVPGVGKTMMVRSIAKTLGAEFKRIQFTPDLLPSDVTGASIFNQKTMTFEYRPGPIHANVVLADEINRTSPKTQSALLEALEEGSVTIDGETRALPQPFFVMATQNPIEYGGTYPLPEAQLDRFLFKIKIGYPSQGQELEVLNRIAEGHPIDRIDPVITLEQVLEMKDQVSSVYVDEAIKKYMIEIVNETGEHRYIFLGVSPRGTIALMKACQAYAFIKGRDYVIPDDVKYLAPHTFAHRIIITSDAKIAGMTGEQIISEVMKNKKVPVKKEAIR